MTPRLVCDAALDLVREQEASGRIMPGSWNAKYLTCYLCPAGVPTIGYGHTAGLTRADVGVKAITVEQAESLLAADMAEFGLGVAKLLAKPATDLQFGAFVSFAFNIGLGGFRPSTVLREHNAGNWELAANAFALWNKGGGRVLPGLVKRRAAEAALYLSGSPGHVAGPFEMPQAVTPSYPTMA